MAGGAHTKVRNLKKEKTKCVLMTKRKPQKLVVHAAPRPVAQKAPRLVVRAARKLVVRARLTTNAQTKTPHKRGFIFLYNLPLI